MAQIGVIMIWVLVSRLLLSVLAFLEWNPKSLIHLFSFRPPLTCPTCFPNVCTFYEGKKKKGFTSFQCLQNPFIRNSPGYTA